MLTCAMQLDGLKIVTVNGVAVTRDMHVYKENLRWSKNLRTWGEAGVVKEGKDGKTDDRGEAMMFFRYPYNHELDSVRMWNLNTN